MTMTKTKKTRIACIGTGGATMFNQLKKVIMKRVNKTGFLVVIFNNDGGGAIADWFEFNNVAVCDIITLLKCIRRRINAYWWGEYKIFYRNREVTLTQSTITQPDFIGRFRKMRRKAMRI